MVVFIVSKDLFIVFTEEFKLERVFIADWIAAYAPLKLKLPL